ncbi:hypothetical protein N9161_02125 [Porticoccaceae bacterium]|nr:hypothetical protein [Porticoccaceae bacterium]MDB4581121.1 hypothetical protein [Porticoccaceae bacterium]MDC0588827.1 hypothetical protein [Porticoccaceae bacterium]MDC3261500.1 hypothetical protein [bacterium]
MTYFLKQTLVIFLVISCWCLLAVVLIDYIVGDLAGLIDTSRQAQAWSLLLLFGLSRSSTLRVANLRIRQWFADTGLAAVVGPALITVRDIVVRGLRSVYVNVYLAADVLFCVGTPLLIISASAGWWLLPEVSYMSLIIYSCVISIIFFAGLWCNLVRLLSLGYFFGHWLVDDAMLRYPFVAPAVVQQNIELLMNDALNALLPAVGLALIVYLLARRYGLEMIKRAFGGRVSQAYERGFGRQIFSNYLLLGCLVMATPLIAVITQIAISHINIHMLFVGLGIWALDLCWQQDVASEPALSSDCRYFLKLSWKH